MAEDSVGPHSSYVCKYLYFSCNVHIYRI